MSSFLRSVLATQPYSNRSVPKISGTAARSHSISGNIAWSIALEKGMLQYIGIRHIAPLKRGHIRTPTHDAWWVASSLRRSFKPSFIRILFLLHGRNSHTLGTLQPCRWDELTSDVLAKHRLVDMVYSWLGFMGPVYSPEVTLFNTSSSWI